MPRGAMAWMPWLGCRLWCAGPARRPREPLGGGIDVEGVMALLGVAGGGWEKLAVLVCGTVFSCIPCDARAGGLGLSAMKRKVPEPMTVHFLPTLEDTAAVSRVNNEDTCLGEGDGVAKISKRPQTYEGVGGRVHDMALHGCRGKRGN